MTSLDKRLLSWKMYDDARTAEQERRALLMKPLPANINPPALMRLVKIKRIGRGFIANGTPVEMGQIVKVSYACARELVYLKKAEFVDPPEAA